MLLHSLDVPVAVSMLELAKKSEQPFQQFMCYWTAFNNIYAIVADKTGLSVSIKKDQDGTPKTETIANVKIVKVDAPGERKQIDSAFNHFSDDLKDNLIRHENIRFFVNRSPEWQGRKIEFDSFGQRLNGVLNVGYTIHADYPVWSPIDKNLYERYMKDPQDMKEPQISSARKELAKQILEVLYTVRNNIVHGGKQADDANSHEVVEKAVPLLSMIVSHFFAA